MASSPPIHAFLEFSVTVLHTILFQNHLLLSHATVAEIMDSGEKGMNPVIMTIINHWTEYWPRQGSNQRLLVLKKSCMLVTELQGPSTKKKRK